MKFTVVKDPIPYVIVEEVFDEDELQRIYRELEFLYPKLLNPEKTGTAKTQDGIPKKKNKGVFLDLLYSIREFSDILTLNRKFFMKDITQEMEKASPVYSLIHNLNHDSTLISYYEDSDYYKQHTDLSVITICTWFFQEPKNFKGGDLFFSDYNICIPVKNNSAVIFFSSIKHEVSEIKMIDKSKVCSGRFTMSMFINQIQK